MNPKVKETPYLCTTQRAALHDKIFLQNLLSILCFTCADEEGDNVTSKLLTNCGDFWLIFISWSKYSL